MSAALHLIMSGKMTEAEAQQYSPLTLAFLGDSVYEALVRSALTEQANMPVQKLHSEKIQFVCAGFQARAAERLELTEAEQAIYRRGRNASVHPPKSADPADYRKATGLEAVFGYLHLTGNTQRMEELFAAVWGMRNELISQTK